VTECILSDILALCVAKQIGASSSYRPLARHGLVPENSLRVKQQIKAVRIPELLRLAAERLRRLWPGGPDFHTDREPV